MRTYANFVALSILGLTTGGPTVRADDDVQTVYREARRAYDRGDYAETEAKLKRAVKLAEKAGEQSPVLDYYVKSLGRFYKERGRPTEALPLLERSRAILARIAGPDSPGVAEVLVEIAEVDYDMGRFEESKRLLDQALGTQEKQGPDFPAMARTLHGLGAVAVMEGKDAEAETLFRRSLSITEKAAGKESLRAAMTLHELAQIQIRKQTLVEADATLKRALAIAEKTGNRPDLQAALVASVASVSYLRGNLDDAEVMYKRALAELEKLLGPEDPQLGSILGNMAKIQAIRGRLAEAETLVKRAIGLQEKAPGGERELLEMLEVHAEALERMGRETDAQAVRARIEAVKRQSKS